MRRRRSFTAVLAVALISLVITTPRARAQAEPGADLRIYLMTFSPGSIIYERFGHNTIVVHDPNPSIERVTQRLSFEAQIGGKLKTISPLLPTDRAHHYGAFDFEQEGFVARFVMGRMEYWTTSDWADLTALAYGADNRSVLLQELNLTPAQKLGMKEFLEWNEQPENRFYRYDYYRDNCSTRVRDAIDKFTGGTLAQQLKQTATGTTLRSHTRRLTSGLDPMDVFWFTGFTYVLGHPVDQPLSAWEECFLPGKLADHVRNVKLTAADGSSDRPLVLGEQYLSMTTRPPMPEAAPTRKLGYAVAGVLTGAVFVGLAKRGANHPPSPGTPGEGRGEGRLRRRLARVAFALLVIPWAILWGVGGIIAANGWAVTDHAASYRNENLLQFSPLILPLAVLAPTVAFGKRRGARAAVFIAIAMASLSALGLVLKIFPPFWQHNGEIIALALPANVGLALALWTLAKRIPARPDQQQHSGESAK